MRIIYDDKACIVQEHRKKVTQLAWEIVKDMKLQEMKCEHTYEEEILDILDDVMEDFAYDKTLLQQRFLQEFMEVKPCESKNE